uniref:G_PROTEIN_RECEP_F1_2 domain-containing protein n=1 Tax=Strongyloides venezuelensis TaxID=75913 RepID=A0A0K0G5M8_STRVS
MKINDVNFAAPQISMSEQSETSDLISNIEKCVSLNPADNIDLLFPIGLANLGYSNTTKILFLTIVLFNGYISCSILDSVLIIYLSSVIST